MQRACELNPSTMAAIIGLPDEKVEEVCGSLNAGVLACANYNNPGQLVISGGKNRDGHQTQSAACQVRFQEKAPKKGGKQ